MTRRQIPIGIRTFREIREGDYYYVDKTGYALELANGHPGNILTRPRLFGKSLLVDTLQELFEGSRELFEGLEAYDKWDWSVTRPVVRLDFTGGDFSVPGSLQANLKAQLDAIERRFALKRSAETASGRLRDILGGLHGRTGKRVAVLIDEYDKPIMDMLEMPVIARAHRDYLVGVYSALEDADSSVRFYLLTGVSNFPLAGIFSGLNDVTDVTFSRCHGAACGYTEEELDTVFAAELPGLDRERMREWYCGYRWGAEKRVYNPHDILQLFRERQFKAWWYDTASPAFQLQTLVKRRAGPSQLEGFPSTAGLLSDIGDDRIWLESLLFQSGYLTIVDSADHRYSTYFRLGYANGAVRQGFNASWLEHLVGDPEKQARNTRRLGQLLREPDFACLERLFHDFFDGMRRENRLSMGIRHSSWYFVSVFYAYFAGLGAEVTVMEGTRATSTDLGIQLDTGGRLDIGVRLGRRVYLFEFMVVEQAGTGAALAHLKARGYDDEYLHLGEPIHLVGVEFSMKDWTVEVFEEELARTG